MIRQELILCAELLPPSIYLLHLHKYYDTSLMPINVKIYREFLTLQYILPHINHKTSENVFLVFDALILKLPNYY